jgi:hypothetical protein
MAANEAVVVGQLGGMGGFAMAGQIGGEATSSERLVSRWRLQAAVGGLADAHRHVHVLGIEIHHAVVQRNLQAHPGVAGEKSGRRGESQDAPSALEHRDRSGPGATERGCRDCQLIRLLQQGRERRKIGALLGQHQLAGAALEERDPELLLQGVDGTGHGGGGLVERGRHGETARFHHLTRMRMRSSMDSPLR